MGVDIKRSALVSQYSLHDMSVRLERSVKFYIISYLDSLL